MALPQKYLAKPELINSNYVWSVYEVETEQVVARHSFEQDARRDAKKRNRGSAWNGWTPAFFLKPTLEVKKIEEIA